MGEYRVTQKDIEISVSAVLRAEVKRGLKSFNISSNKWTCVPYNGHPNALNVLLGHIALFAFALLISIGPFHVIAYLFHSKLR